LKTALIWGALPGATDETIYIMAHRDGWFDASGDNASGVASMLGLAEHYSKIPQAQRKRTMVFVALDGHHNSGEGSAVGNAWITQNRQKLFARTALAINVEHPATIQTQSRPRYYNANEIVWGNTYMPQQWYAGGPSRPELQKIVFDAFRQFGATLDLFPNPTPPASDMSSFFRFLPGVDTSEYHHYFHTDLETPQTVPWTGLEASTRAYAKIIDEVNKLPLSTFRRPDEPTPARQ
jgi:Zn-dependent M28 family amino/carboxypeptidase